MTVSSSSEYESTAPPANMRAPSTPLYVLDSSQGLASNQVHRIARDHECRIWLAGPVGLARFDGYFIHEWDRRNGLQCNGLRCVAIDAMGSIWIGTDLGFELLDKNGQPLAGVEPGTWRFGLCQHIDVSGRNQWIGTAQGLVKLEPQSDKPGYRVAFSAEIGFVSDIKLIHDQRVLAASAVGGLIETDGRTWWSYRSEGLLGRRVTRIALGHNGEILVGTDDGLYVIDDSTRQVICRLKLAQIDPIVTAVCAGTDRNWAAFGQTLVAWASKAQPPRVIEQILVDCPVNDLLIDELGNVLIATNSSGLAMVSCLRQAIERIDLGSVGGVHSIKPGAADSYTIGGENIFGKTVPPSERRVVRLGAPDGLPQTEDWDILARTRISLQGWSGLPDTVVWDSLEDESGIWVATQAGLYRASASGVFSQFFAQDPQLGAPGRVLLKRGEQMWAGTLRGLSCIRDGEAVNVDANGAPLGYVYALHLDDESALWIATLGRGLWREKNGLEAITVGPLSEVGNTYAVVQGPTGKIIVLQDEKVVLLDRDLNARLVTELPPVSGWTAVWIDAHTIAIGASDGLRIVDVDNGNVLSRVHSLFKLREWEFTNNRSLVRDRYGRFLCGLNSGLVRVDLKQLQSFTPPVCKLLDVTWTGVEPEYAGAVVQIRPGRWSFRLRAFAAWFVDSANVYFQFQLVGFDEHWSQQQGVPEVSFTSLPAGKYRLLCRAGSPLTGLGPEACLLSLDVRRPVWAMGWSAALVAAESIYDQQVRSRKRNEALREKTHMLELAVAERTKSLLAANQELEAVRDAYERLSEVDELTQLGNRRNFEREISRAIPLSARLNVPLTLLMVDIDHFKSVNDRLGHATGDEYLKAVGRVLISTIRVGEDVATRFGGEEFAILLVNTGHDGALSSAERIRKGVEGLSLPNEGAPAKIVTISIGFATINPDQNLTRDDLVLQADRALYRAKNNGRNQVSA